MVVMYTACIRGRAPPFSFLPRREAVITVHNSRVTKNHGSIRERITRFFPTARESLCLRRQANLILFSITRQQPTQPEETEMYLRPKCPLRCGFGAATILYCQNHNALESGGVWLAWNCVSREGARECRKACVAKVSIRAPIFSPIALSGQHHVVCSQVYLSF